MRNPERRGIQKIPHLTMKKKISMIVLCSMLFGATASAQETILVTKDEKMLTYKADSGRFILAGYIDGVLKNSYVMKNEQGVFTAPYMGDEYDMRLCDVENNKVYDISIETLLHTPPSEEITETEKEQTYNPNKFPEETYDRALDAYYAFSVINKVANILSDDGEICYEVEFMNQGEIKKEIIDTDVEIVSSPTAEPGLLGESAASLKKGDVVYFDRMINGEIEGIGFIMRPPSGNTINSVSYGTDFEELISTERAVAGYNAWPVAQYGGRIASGKGATQYAFGICGYKTGNFLYLVNKE